MPITLIPMALADVENFRECMDAVARERSYIAITEAPAVHQLQSQFRRGAENGDVHIIARDEQQRVLGWAQVQRGQGAAVAHRGDLGMGVHPDWRGQGLGKRLLSACVGTAGAKGINSIELEVRCDNRSALNLYRSLGFTMESVVRDAMFIDGVFHNAFRMTLAL
ncbi:N-acetyltransferase family protein [Paucibacter sp. JuS9]|uniref:GNAT family N-acetyltransferase n=1 Tax=Paucibacter sp. JuS9 TaxID=3228748 RepID=UPI0037576E85